MGAKSSKRAQQGFVLSRKQKVERAYAKKFVELYGDQKAAWNEFIVVSDATVSAFCCFDGKAQFYFGKDGALVFRGVLSEEKFTTAAFVQVQLGEENVAGGTPVFTLVVGGITWCPEEGQILDSHYSWNPGSFLAAISRFGEVSEFTFSSVKGNVASNAFVDLLRGHAQEFSASQAATLWNQGELLVDIASFMGVKLVIDYSGPLATPSSANAPHGYSFYDVDNRRPSPLFAKYHSSVLSCIMLAYGFGYLNTQNQARGPENGYPSRTFWENYVDHLQQELRGDGFVVEKVDGLTGVPPGQYKHNSSFGKCQFRTLAALSRLIHPVVGVQSTSSAVVAVSHHDKFVIIGYRGSMCGSDWSMNGNVQKIDLTLWESGCAYYNPEAGFVGFTKEEEGETEHVGLRDFEYHQGFATYYLSTKLNLQRTLSDLLAGHDASAYKFLFTGHSLGAAAASIAAVDFPLTWGMMNQVPLDSCGGYYLGSPKPVTRSTMYKLHETGWFRPYNHLRHSGFDLANMGFPFAGDIAPIYVSQYSRTFAAAFVAAPLAGKIFLVNPAHEHLASKDWFNLVTKFDPGNFEAYNKPEPLFDPKFVQRLEDCCWSSSLLGKILHGTPVAPRTPQVLLLHGTQEMADRNEAAVEEIRARLNDVLGRNPQGHNRRVKSLRYGFEGGSIFFDFQSSDPVYMIEVQYGTVIDSLKIFAGDRVSALIGRENDGKAHRVSIPVAPINGFCVFTTKFWGHKCICGFELTFVSHAPVLIGKRSDKQKKCNPAPNGFLKGLHGRNGWYLHGLGLITQ